MKTYDLNFNKQATNDLSRLRRYLARRFDPASVESFLEDVVADCSSLAIAPHRGRTFGKPPDGFRITGGAKGRVSITFRVMETQVVITSIRYRGRSN